MKVSRVDSVLVAAALAACCVVASAVPAQQQLVLGKQNMRLIEVGPGERRWIAEEQKLEYIRNGTRFMDVTDHKDLGAANTDGQTKEAQLALPNEDREIRRKILELINTVSTNTMKGFLDELTAFHTRYYLSETGVQAGEFLYDEINAIAKASGKNITVTKFQHSWAQFSIIARFEPDAPMDNDIAIVGAHYDSVNKADVTGRAPGADDDASGTATSLEAFRVLATDYDYMPDRRALEFHWYSASEAGLMGSQDVAASYKAAGKKVNVMLQNDMSGYHHPGVWLPQFGIVEDNSDAAMTKYLADLLRIYVQVSYVVVPCGYACSDHVSWNKVGAHSGVVLEAANAGYRSPNIHTEKDTVATLDFDYLELFTSLVISFAVLGGHEG